MSDIKRVKVSSEQWAEVRKGAVDWTDEEYESMWDEPEVEGSNVQKLYGKGELVLGKVCLQADPEVPAMVQRCMDFAKANYPKGDAKEHLPWNAALVQWRSDGARCVGVESEDSLMYGAPIMAFACEGEVEFEVTDDDECVSANFVIGDADALVMGNEGDGTRKYKYKVMGDSASKSVVVMVYNLVQAKEEKVEVK